MGYVYCISYCIIIFYTFNSLYGIHRNGNEVIIVIPLNFQFPLWDTETEGTNDATENNNTFNSLYGILGY